MAVCLPSLRTFIRPVLYILLTTGLAITHEAYASHERPWAIAPSPAHIIQRISLPGESEWTQAVTVRNGTVVVLRTRDAKGGPLLVKLLPSAQQTDNFVLRWPDNASAGHLVTPISLAVDETGQLWLLDQGDRLSPPRLLQIEPSSGHVLNDQPLPSGAVTATSRFTDLTVRGNHAYLADQGGTALTVLDLTAHTASRFFAGYPGLRGHSPLVIDHKTVTNSAGLPVTRDIAMLALQPDGKWLYEQAPSGPLYRLSTDLLTDQTVTPSELMEGVTEWRGTPTLGGLTTGPDATVYLTDITNGRLLAFGEDRLPFVLLSDPVLVHAGIPTWAKGTDGTSQMLIPAGHNLLRVALP